MATPLTDAITALTTYANTVTGASDTTLSDAVGTLAAGYGGGGGGGLTVVASGTYTGADNNPSSAGMGFSIGKKMAKTDFMFRIIAQPDSEFPYDTYYKYVWGIAILDSDIAEFDLSSAGTAKQPVSVKSVKVNNSGTVSNVNIGSFVCDMGYIRNGSASYNRASNVRIDQYSDRFEIRMFQSNTQYRYANGIKYDWELIYYGSNPSSDIVTL